MTEYLVQWTIEIQADSPEDAARQALALQRDPSSLTACFQVAGDDDGEYETIDLDELDSRVERGAR